MTNQTQKQFRIFYNGDSDIEQGGYFYSLEGVRHGYADFVRVIPCADFDGPLNCYVIERGNVNIPKDEHQLKMALDCCGAWGAYQEASLTIRLHITIDACMSYGFVDIDSTETVQIGATLDGAWPDDLPYTTVNVLRGNTSLQRYVRAIAVKGF